MIGKVLPWIVALFIVLWIIRNPVGAGSDVHGWVTSLFAFAGSAGGH
jgi:hypothetical protein